MYVQVDELLAGDACDVRLEVVPDLPPLVRVYFARSLQPPELPLCLHVFADGRGTRRAAGLCVWSE